jgi:DNA mismatch endonuclease (patch repair protein)
MADVVDRATRSRMMSGIRSANTKPEMKLRKSLHARGFRFRLHDRKLPGTPDIVLPRWKAVIEVRGCFWHRHEGCRYATTPATRPEFWKGKFNANLERDRRNELALTSAGWRVAIVWECAVRSYDPLELIDSLEAWLKSDGPRLEIPASQQSSPDSPNHELASPV